jgi:hypothetical protein
MARSRTSVVIALSAEVPPNDRGSFASGSRTQSPPCSTRTALAQEAKRGTDRDFLPRPGPRSVEVIDTANDIREFLISRRAKITPEQAGLPAYGSSRRVQGL